jgi:hypothetical protein
MEDKRKLFCPFYNAEEQGLEYADVAMFPRIHSRPFVTTEHIAFTAPRSGTLKNMASNMPLISVPHWGATANWYLFLYTGGASLFLYTGGATANWYLFMYTRVLQQTGIYVSDVHFLMYTGGATAHWYLFLYTGVLQQTGIYVSDVHWRCYSTLVSVSVHS